MDETHESSLIIGRINMKTFLPYRYYAISVDFETYYPQSPQKPLWVHCMWEEIMRLRPKRLPISDNHIYEQNKKFFSFKRATKYKVSPYMLCRNFEF